MELGTYPEIPVFLHSVGCLSFRAGGTLGSCVYPLLGASDGGGSRRVVKNGACDPPWNPDSSPLGDVSGCDPRRVVRNGASVPISSPVFSPLGGACGRQYLPSGAILSHSGEAGPSSAPSVEKSGFGTLP
jgi:hypothetical protein